MQQQQSHTIAIAIAYDEDDECLVVGHYNRAKRFSSLVCRYARARLVLTFVILNLIKRSKFFKANF